MTVEPNEVKYNNLSSIIIANRGSFDPNFDEWKDGNTTHMTNIPDFIKNSEKYDSNYAKKLSFDKRNIVDITDVFSHGITPFTTNHETAENIKTIRDYLTKTEIDEKTHKINTNVLLITSSDVLQEIENVNKLKQKYIDSPIRNLWRKILKKPIPEFRNSQYIIAIFNDAINQPSPAHNNDLYTKWAEIPEEGEVNLQKYSWCKNPDTIGRFVVDTKYNSEYHCPNITLEDRNRMRYHIKFTIPEEEYCSYNNSELEKALMKENKGDGKR